MAENKPDVLILMTDQWNSRMMGCAGYDQIRTPNIDALAAEGVLFDAAYTQSPVCMPARGSLASALYPHNHGFWTNFTERKFPAAQITMFRDIQAAGYSTAKIGKFHYFNPEWGESHADYQAYYDQLGLDWAQELPTPYMGPYLRNEYTAHLRERGLLDAYLQDIAHRFEVGDFDVIAPSPLPPEDHPDGYIARQSIDYIGRCPMDKPMFLFVSLPGPHSPFDAPRPYDKMYDPQDMVLAPNVPEQIGDFDRDHVRRMQANYFGKLTALDDWVGRIVEAMQARGTWDEALVVFMADHGEYMGSHSRKGKGGFEEESARVPLILRWPGQIPGGQRTSALAELIDVYPTIVDAIGGVMSPDRFGCSLLPLVTGETDAVHDAVFSEIGRRPLNYMVRTPRFKWFVRNGREALHDMAADPYELENLIDSEAHREIVDEMHERLRQFLMAKQVNFSEGYKSLFTRIGLLEERREGMAERLLERFRRLHSET
jgi:choline-sulfatase